MSMTKFFSDPNSECDLSPDHYICKDAGPCNEKVPSIEWWQVKTRDGEMVRSETFLRCKRHAAMLDPDITRQRPRS